MKYRDGQGENSHIRRRKMASQGKRQEKEKENFQGSLEDTYTSWIKKNLGFLKKSILFIIYLYDCIVCTYCGNIEYSVL